MKHYPVSQPSLTPLETRAVLRTMESGWLTQGETVRSFEKALCQHLSVEHVVACASGTAALHLVMAALGYGAGDEVLVPDLSYVATANAVTYVGARPVLVDVDSTTWNMNLDDAARHLSSRTRAILVVHLYGKPCNMDAVNEFAAVHGLVVVEDAAQAFGAYWADSPCGTLGLCGTFSFYANKIITTVEGGAVVTNDDKLAETVRLLRGQAQSPDRRFWHSEVGFNYRMTELQAAIGLTQLKRLPHLLEERHRVVNRYLDNLKDTICSPMNRWSAPWLFTGLLPVDRPYHLRVEEDLAKKGIETRSVFVPMHRLPMYARPEGQFPSSSELADYGVSLPTYPELTNDDVDYISSTVMDLCNRGSSTWPNRQTATKSDEIRMRI